MRYGLSRLAAGVAAASVLILGAGCGGEPEVRARTTAEPLGPRAPRTEGERQELSFLIGMVPHHAQAIDMAKLCGDRAAHAELREMCVEVVVAQSAEVGHMTRWALDWYGTQLSEVQSALYSAEGARGANGTLPDEQVSELASLSGTEFDLRFIGLMSEHHRGAILSAEGLKQVSPHPEVRQLAAAIVTAQDAEVQRMEAWRIAWTT